MREELFGSVILKCFVGLTYPLLSVSVCSHIGNTNMMEDTRLTETGSAAKRHRQSLKRRLRNRAVKSRVRTTTKRFLQAYGANDKATAEQQFLMVTKLIDSAAGKGIYHKNTAARTKSRLHKKLNSIISAGSGVNDDAT
jgi:small subunit ribosomal protein S20